MSTPQTPTGPAAPDAATQPLPSACPATLPLPAGTAPAADPATEPIAAREATHPAPADPSATGSTATGLTPSGPTASGPASADGTPAGPPPPGPDAPAGAAPGPRRRSTAGRVLTGVGAVLGGVLIAQLAATVLAEASARTETAVQTYAAAPVVELVTDGAVDVRVVPGADVQVERTARVAWQDADYVVDEGGDRLTVTHRCGWQWVGVCSASLAVELPEGTDVVVRSSDGDVRAEGPVGAVALRTWSGAVEVVGARGDVEARTSDGDVSVQDVGGAVQARSSSGHVQVTDAAGRVVAATSDGDVRVRGAGDDTEASSTSGHVEVDGVAGSAVARTSDGDVTVAGVTGDATAHTWSGHATVYGTGEPVALEISTLDGRQTVDAPTDPSAARRVTVTSSDGDVAYLGPRG